jgi:hypothetical protein
MEMNGFGLQDLGKIGGTLFGTQQTGGSTGGATDGSFGTAFDNATQAYSALGTGQAAGASASPARFSLGGADGSTEGTTPGAAGSSLDAADQLAQYLSMPLNKRMFYMVLASLGISQQEYDAMTPQEQAKVAAQVAQRLKDNAEAQKQVAQGRDTLAASV